VDLPVPSNRLKFACGCYMQADRVRLFSEGPFVYKHFQYFYLLVSLGHCCRGVDSDYNLVVGRSRTVEGPYVDRDGKLLSRGGGTPIAKGNADFQAWGTTPLTPWTARAS
jgi:beta-xylosidase